MSGMHEEYWSMYSHDCMIASMKAESANKVYMTMLFQFLCTMRGK